jgi:predicted nucleic acid-binding protein
VLLVDASVWVALVAPGERFHLAAGSLLDSSHSLAALDLTLYEVANAVGVKMANRDRARRLAAVIATRCGDRLVRADAGLMDSAIAIAAEHGLTAYDAAYVAAARRHGWTLVSAEITALVSKDLAVAPDAALYP